ncbi:VOC family protein [Miniimonas arenae]|uniref:VOC family protein n=1 Tax=Miniimonas arenae TaxID=676201 RepID=A0A5C5BDX1_9MICO|nr:VOC family protein [Miniimonas arenae]TNU76701.1 VOC family protein [Miniimonas arenae]
MFDHVGVQVNDPAATTTALLAAFAPIGLVEMVRHDSPGGLVVGLGDRQLGDRPGSGPYLWLSAAPEGGVRHEAHIALSAPSREAVESVHEAATAAGLEILHAPREWPEYHPGYYAVFFRDLDGNNVEAVHAGS